jgi:hypothetical protein
MRIALRDAVDTSHEDLVAAVAIARLVGLPVEPAVEVADEHVEARMDVGVAIRIAGCGGVGAIAEAPCGVHPREVPEAIGRGLQRRQDARILRLLEVLDQGLSLQADHEGFHLVRAGAKSCRSPVRS